MADRYVIHSGWIYRVTGQHDCFSGSAISWNHEPGCGLEPVATVEDAQKALAEVHRLHSWAGLMELLNEHWPADIFEMGDTPDAAKESTADPGVRIVALIRWVDRLSAELQRWESGVRRKSWPVIDAVPDGLHYAAELAEVQLLREARTAALEWATTILRSPGDMPVADVAWKLRRIFGEPVDQEAVPR